MQQAQQVQQVQQVQQPLLYQQQLPLVAQPQLGMMNHLKEQLEERTRILQADIKTQQQELHDIKEKLQLANFQVTPYARMLTHTGSTAGLATASLPPADSTTA